MPYIGAEKCQRYVEKKDHAMHDGIAREPFRT